MQLNRFVRNTEFPPVTEAAGWVGGRTFPTERPLIDVSQAVPGYPTAPEVLDHIADLLRNPATSRYGHVLGLPDLRETYAAELNSLHQSSVNPSNIAITAGCNQAFYVAAAALCQPGDEIILPAPWYFNHKMSLDMLGIQSVALPCAAADKMVPDTDTARALLTPHTRAIVLISPNNPTGQEYPPATIDAFYQLCKEAGIALIVDETYRDFRSTPEQPPHSFFSDNNWSDTAVHLYSFSKAYALAGYRVGALAASETLLHEVTKVLDCVAICAPQLSQHAALFGLQNAANWKEEKRQLMYDRAAAFADAISPEHPYTITAMGAYFAYLQHPFESTSATGVAKSLADNANLLTLPGDMFGEQQDRYLRIAFANVDSALMPIIADRLQDHLTNA